MKIPKIAPVFLGVAMYFGFSLTAWAGYDLHITRAKEWTESKKAPIPIEVWVTYVKGDSEFRLAISPDSKSAPKDAIWTNPKDKQECYFYYFDGEIIVKDPNPSAIAKMKIIASKLDAKVVGDEDEDYK